MRIYDISQEVFSCAVYPGDPSPRREVLSSTAEGAVCNLTAFSMCAHNGTHIDAPFHFVPEGKTVGLIWASGAGKTTFTKGLALGLGIEDTVTSPTFTILKSYEGEDVTLHHMDAYRLEGIVQDLGFEEEIYDENAVCVIEWSHFIEYALPEERLEIKILLDGEDRIFTFIPKGKKYEEIVEAL